MPQAFDPEATFLEILPLVERVAEKICRRYFVPDQAEDVASIAKTKLFANDYADLRAYRGDAALTTFVTTVVINAFHEVSRRVHGRWRNSAAARKLGPVAMELEALVRRDGVPLREAAEQLRAAGKTDLSDRALAAMLERIPLRDPLRPVDVGPQKLEDAPGGAVADGRLIAKEERRRYETMIGALKSGIAGLDPEERILIEMCYMERRKVADAARALGVPQKPLYRKLENALKKLRVALEQAGFGVGEFRELFEYRDVEAP